MISLRVYFILGLVISSFAQLDIQELFQIDIETNAEGGCHYVGHEQLNRLLADCLQLANTLITAIDDSRDTSLPLYVAAQDLIKAYFKPINWALDTNHIRGIYFLNIIKL